MPAISAWAVVAMSSSENTPGAKLISDGAQTAYERWELPNMGKPEPREEELEELPKPPTAEEIEAIRQAAHAEGLEAGRREGLAAGQAEINARAQRLEQIILEFAEPLRLVDERVEGELVELVIAIAQQIIRRQLAIDPGEVVGLVREALAALPAAARRIQVFLHPEDAALVREALEMGSDEERRWRIVEDPMLSRGGCRLSSEHSQIDATVEKRLNAVIAELLGGARRDDQQPLDESNEPVDA